jgi:hypothetical protein
MQPLLKTWPYKKGVAFSEEDNLVKTLLCWSQGKQLFYFKLNECSGFSRIKTTTTKGHFSYHGRYQMYWDGKKPFVKQQSLSYKTTTLSLVFNVRRMASLEWGNNFVVFYLISGLHVIREMSLIIEEWLLQQ